MGEYELPLYARFNAAGDDEGTGYRTTNNIRRQGCAPASFGSPTISSDGTVYVGHASGGFYAIGDYNDDGLIDNSTEVSVFKPANISAPLHPGTSWAPGFMGFASCDSLYVFRF